MKVQIVDNCQLEFHPDRGMLYIRRPGGVTGVIILRVSRIPLGLSILDEEGKPTIPIDVTAVGDFTV